MYYPIGSHSATAPSQFSDFLGSPGCSAGVFRARGGVFGGLGGILEPNFVVMLLILRQNLAAFCLLAWKRLLHRFSVVFWESRNLHFLSLVEANLQFCHFGRRRCWHRFWHQKPLKMDAKMAPRGSHEAPRSM